MTFPGCPSEKGAKKKIKKQLRPGIGKVISDVARGRGSGLSSPRANWSRFICCGLENNLVGRTTKQRLSTSPRPRVQRVLGVPGIKTHDLAEDHGFGEERGQKWPGQRNPGRFQG